MNILITNDDGIKAPGIAALVRAFSSAGHTVVVCAPDSQRSAASQALTIARPMTVREMPFDGAVQAFAIGGTPADCVKLGLLKLCPQAQAVVSGINCGYNVGTDILYSGTVGAAVEGAINARPAMAVSQPRSREEYDRAAALAVQAFEGMIAEPLPFGCVLNVNYPDCDEIRGLVRARMQPLHYDEQYVPGMDENGALTYTLMGVIEKGCAQSEDYERLCEGYATATVISYNMTDVQAMQSIKFIL
ncbi:MAG: 5'/3'-nucleotidase SurE [Clostridia bacterium]|nr:5'/3'-nucleotidase SurE [Clostridia bacterium]